MWLTQHSAHTAALGASLHSAADQMHELRRAFAPFVQHTFLSDGPTGQTPQRQRYSLPVPADLIPADRAAALAYIAQTALADSPLRRPLQDLNEAPRLSTASDGTTRKPKVLVRRDTSM